MYFARFISSEVNEVEMMECLLKFIFNLSSLRWQDLSTYGYNFPFEDLKHLSESVSCALDCEGQTSAVQHGPHLTDGVL